jgi:predicted flap endonuclease-1-like 5' DNA nuclease
MLSHYFTLKLSVGEKPFARHSYERKFNHASDRLRIQKVKGMVMRNPEDFRKYLRRKGKKDHVVDDLMTRCELFQQFLQERSKQGLDKADDADLLDYVDGLKDKKTDVNNHLRAIALYYKFKSNSKLSSLASNLRSQRISAVRKSFALGDFRGINRKYLALLEKEGITTADQILERGKTPESRKDLSVKTGIPLKSITEYVKLSDLSRIEGVKTVRARLYFDAGVNTLDKMASWDPVELRSMLVSYVERTGFNGIAPLPKELRNTVETAKRLRRIVDYNE